MESSGNLTLVCAFVGVQGPPFAVEIADNRLVAFLEDEIKAKAPATVTCDARVLQLYVAKKNGHRWLPDDDPAAFELNERDIHPAVQELIGGYEMNPTRTIESCLFVDGGMPEPNAENIHILVVLPEQKAQVWQTTCSVDNSLTTNGVRYAVHRLLESHFGYYDPELLRNGLDKAMWYDGKTLRIHALFEEKRDALQFENALLDEGMAAMSALSGLRIKTNVAEVSRMLTGLRRIHTMHYDPQESESPKNSLLDYLRREGA